MLSLLRAGRVPARASASALSLAAARTALLLRAPSPLALSALRFPLPTTTTRAFASVRNDDDDGDDPKRTPAAPATATAAQQQQQQLQTQQKKPGKIRALIAQYGMPFLIWWTAVWAGTGVGLFVAFDTGVLAGADAIQFVMDMGLDRFVDVSALDPTYGNMALAAVLNELIEPVRFPFAVATLPMVKRVFTRKTAAAPTDQTTNK